MLEMAQAHTSGMMEAQAHGHLNMQARGLRWPRSARGACHPLRFREAAKISTVSPEGGMYRPVILCGVGGAKTLAGKNGRIFCGPAGKPRIGQNVMARNIWPWPVAERPYPPVNCWPAESCLSRLETRKSVNVPTCALANICGHENSDFQIRERLEIGICIYPDIVALANTNWHIRERANRWRNKIAKRNFLIPVARTPLLKCAYGIGNC